MKLISFSIISLLLSLVVCEYPYFFGNSINTGGIAKALGNRGYTQSKTTNWSLDDVSQSIAHSNGTGESNSRTSGESLWSPQRHGASTNADAVNTGYGNTFADSVSKSFSPSDEYYNENYKEYIEFLNSLFKKYPNKSKEIIKVVLKYADLINKGKSIDELDAYKADYDLNNQKTHWKHYDDNRRRNPYQYPIINGYPATLANFNDPNFQNIGQTTFDHQRAHGSGLNTSASTNSGSYSWNDEVIHKGNAVGNADRGWAKSNSNSYGFGRINYINTEQSAGAYGDNAQTNSESNYILRNGAVSNDGQAWGRAEGNNSKAFSNLNGNVHGYGNIDGNTNSYTDGDVSVSKSEIKGEPHIPKF